VTFGAVDEPNVDAFDRVTGLFHTTPGSTATTATTTTTAAATATAAANANSVTDPGVATVIPQKMLFSLTTKNIAFSRKILGPTFLLFSAIQGLHKDKDKENNKDNKDNKDSASGSGKWKIGTENYDLILGWYLKTIGKQNTQCSALRADILLFCGIRAVPLFFAILHHAWYSAFFQFCAASFCTAPFAALFCVALL
jgi:hypothetical protein